MKPIHVSSLILLFCCMSPAAFAQHTDSLKLSDVLQSHMVVQQHKPFKIWGSAPQGANIEIQADWMPHPLRVISDRQGKFVAIIDVPSARPGDYTPHRIVLTSGRQSIVLKDLLIGDLWFCSGQSNMQFSVKELTDSAAVIRGADNAHIRLLNVALNFSKEPVSHMKGSWVRCSSETVKNFSAVGYCFGAELQRQLDIPVGLIFSGIGASKVQAFVPRKVLGADSLLNRVYLQPYLQSPRSKEIVNAGFSFEKVTRPFLLYNALIYPFIRLSIKGFCWYQGESNDLDRAPYVRATEAMILAWRRAFGQGELPFDYVQIAPYDHEKKDPTLDFDAFFRECQEQVSEVNNTAMVSSMDIGDGTNLHPKNKKPIGIRLAKVALNRTYGRLSVPYQGPQYMYINIEQDKAVIHFQPGTVRSALVTRDGKDPRFFYIAGKDRVFYPAEARISGKEVIVHADRVRHPIAVRYAFFNYPVTNLQNADGFPANPFRTDDWPEKKPPVPAK